MADQDTQSKEQNLTIHAAWLVSAKLLSFAINIAVPLLLVRKLDQHSYGIYKQVFLVAASAVQLIPLGFGSNTYYFFPRLGAQRPSVSANTFLHTGLLGVLTSIAFATFPVLLSFLTKDPEVVTYSGLIGLVAGFWMTGYLIEIIPIVNGESRIAGLLIVGSQVCRGVMLFTAGAIAGTVNALLWAAILHGVLQVSAVAWYLHTRFPGFHKSLDLGIWKQQIAYMARIVLPLMVGQLLIDLPSYAVAKLVDPATYAIFATGLFNIPLATILWEGTGIILLRQVTELDSRGERSGILLLCLAAARKLALGMFPMAAVFAVLSTEFVIFMFTRTYAASAPIFIANVMAIPTSIFMTDAISRIYPEKQHHQLAIRTSALVLLGLVLFTIGRNSGILFAAIAATSAITLERLAMTVYWSRQLGAHWRDLAGLWPILRIAAVTVVASGVCYFSKQFMAGWPPLAVLLTAGTIFLVTYVALLLVARVVTPEEVSLVRSVFDRLRGRPVRATI